jgi:GH15 family glucan-1,4-alpha-glucosidase
MAEKQSMTRPYQPINIYGVIGNCRSVLLVAPDGSIDWGCLPDFDSPAIFCRILDAERGGYFQIAPTDSAIEGTQAYLDGSNVLATRFVSAEGEIVLTDCMPVETLNAWPLQAPNAEAQTQEDGVCHCLVRIVECRRGEMPVTMTLKITPDYAAAASKVALLPENAGAVISGGEQHVGLGIVGAYRLPSFFMKVFQEEAMHPRLVVQATLREGERLLFALEAGGSFEAARDAVQVQLPRRNLDAEMAHTLHCWRQWLAGCTYEGRYASRVQRSALVLKLMTYAPTGGIVAAPTTSLPEVPGGGQNWDYRFTWLRDGAFTSYVFVLLGFMQEPRAFLHWLLQLPFTDVNDMQIIYGIRGERDLTERELPHLSGYRGARPVRIGNGAMIQKQHDVFGEALDCLYFFSRRGGFGGSGEGLAGPLWEKMRSVIEYVCAHWQGVDSGIWEVRGEFRHYVYSKVMCWVALDRGIKLAQTYQLEADLPRWIQVRDDMRAEILTRGYNAAAGAFTQSFDESALDASTLMMPLVGFISPDDPRMISTVDHILEHLTDEHGFVYRYLAQNSPASNEGTFTICSFWLIDNLAMQGRLAEARALFERLLAYAGPTGLFSEEIDAPSGMALGTYPQAFTHLALVNSAVNLHRAEKRLADQEGAAY